MENSYIKCKKIEEPTSCPFCGKPLSRKIEGGAHLYCVNPNCKERNIQKLTYFAKKECMNIDGLSEKTIRKLYDAGVVTRWQDFLTRTAFDYYMAGLGEKTSEKIVENFNKSLSTLGPERSLMSMGIPMIGKVTAAKLVDAYNGTEELISDAELRKVKVEGVGAVALKSFCDYVLDNWEEMIDMVNFLPNKKSSSQFKAYSNKLEGLRMLATGNLVSFSREGIKESIQNYGGIYASGVNSKLDYLIVGSEAGPSKLAKARELGIKMITEEDYLEMIGEDPILPVKYETVPVSKTSDSVSLF